MVPGSLFYALGVYMRHWFGGTPSDWTMEIPDPQTRDILVKGGATLTFWSAAVGGFQYTVRYGEADVTTIITGDGNTLPLGAIPEFQGPDADPPIRRMYCQAGSSAYRFVLPCTDLGSTVYEHTNGTDPHGDRAYVDDAVSDVVRNSVVQDTAPGAVIFELHRNYPITTLDAEVDAIYGPDDEKVTWRNEIGHYRAKTYSGNSFDPQYRAIAEKYQSGHAFQLLDNKSPRNLIWGVTPDGGTEVNGLRMSYVLFLGPTEDVPVGTPPNTLIVRL